MNRYTETLNYLYAALPMYQRVGPIAYKATLDNTIALCKALGNPERKFKSIHIAGTNGKGSVSHMLAAILQSAGYRTGLYTSPHLKEFTERIRIDGKEVEKEFVVEFIDRMRSDLDRIQPSFFEMTVAMAFDYFSQQKVDVAVIEVGLGGRLDSTNVIHPELSIITNISWDHMNLLGDTLEKIAMEKAGIIKQRVPVIIGERQPEVEEVFINRAAQLQCDLVFAQDIVQLDYQSGAYDVYRQGTLWIEGLAPDLKGLYQLKNLPGVLSSLVALRELGFTIHDEAVTAGIQNTGHLTGLKGRWQILGYEPLTICDTGHNVSGIQAVVEQLETLPHQKLHLVIGMVNDKDISKVLRLLPKDGVYYFCQSKIPRALEAAKLARQAAEAGLRGEVVPDVNVALQRAWQEAGTNDIVFVGGSTFVVAEIDDL